MRVLVLSSTNTNYIEEIQSIITEILGTCTISTLDWTNYNGASLNTTNTDLILPLCNYNSAAGTNMPTAGQTGILNFIKSGGAMLTCEHIYMKIATVPGTLSVLDPVLPIIYSNIPSSRSQIRFKSIQTNTIINNGLPPEFQWVPSKINTLTETYLTVTKPNTITFYDSIPTSTSDSTVCAIPLSRNLFVNPIFYPV